jgi:hypothetical protein
MDPEGRTDPCGAKGGTGHCNACGHDAAAQPADTSAHGSDYTEL